MPLVPGSFLGVSPDTVWAGLAVCAQDRSGDMAGRLWQDEVCWAVHGAAVFCPVITLELVWPPKP